MSARSEARATGDALRQAKVEAPELRVPGTADAVVKPTCIPVSGLGDEARQNFSTCAEPQVD